MPPPEPTATARRRIPSGVAVITHARATRDGSAAYVLSRSTERSHVSDLLESLREPHAVAATGHPSAAPPLRGAGTPLAAVGLHLQHRQPGRQDRDHLGAAQP